MKERLVQLPDSFMTEDTHTALMEAMRFIRPGASVTFSGSPVSIRNWGDLEVDPGPTGMAPKNSMRNTGREVYVRLGSASENDSKLIPELWSALVPKGFVPWDRYPNPSGTDTVFHYFGDWYSIGDSLQGEGMGEHSWSSMCIASQLEIGVWEGTRPVERSVQSHLHRIGVPCGPLDGVIGERALRALRSLGMSGMSLEDVLEKLKNVKITKERKEERRVGQLSIEEAKVRVFCSGSARTRRTRSGLLLYSWGPGVFNVIMDE